MSGDSFVVVVVKPEIATGYFKFTSPDEPDDETDTPTSNAVQSSSIPGVSAVEAAFLVPNGHIIPTILARIKDKGFEIVQRRMRHFTRAEARYLFSFELKQRFDDDEQAFASLLTAVTNGPILALLLKLPASGDSNAAIKKWNELAGDWDPVVARKKALAESVPHDQWPLRALCGLNSVQNGFSSSSDACCVPRERFFLFPPTVPHLKRATIVLLPSFHSNFPDGKELLLSTIGKETRAIVVENKEGCALSVEETIALCGLTRTYNEGPVGQVCTSVVELLEQAVGEKGVDILVLEGLDLNFTLRPAVGPANVELAKLYFPGSIRAQVPSKMASVELPAGLLLKETVDDGALEFESGLFLSFDSKLSIGKADDVLGGATRKGPAIECTLGLIKPNAACNPDVVAEIMRMINLFGFTVERQRRLLLSRDQAAAFYAEHRGKSFFETLLGFMTSGEIVALQLSRPYAIKAWRALMGPTNSIKARETHPWTLRACFGVDGTRNATHGSDSSTSAAREVCFFFGSALSASSAAGKLPNGVVPSTRTYAQQPMAVFGVPNSSIENVLTQGLKELLEQKVSDPLEACRWLGEWLVSYRSRGLEENSGDFEESQTLEPSLKPDTGTKRVSDEGEVHIGRKVVAITLDAAINNTLRVSLLDALRERLEDTRYEIVDVESELSRFTTLASGVANLVKILKDCGRRRCVLFGCSEFSQNSAFHREFKTLAPPDWQINFVVQVDALKNDEKFNAGVTMLSSSLDVPVFHASLPSTSNLQNLQEKNGPLGQLFRTVFVPNIVLVVDQESLVPSAVWTEVANHFGFNLLTFEAFVASLKTSNDESSETRHFRELLRSGSNVPPTLILTVLRRVILGTQPGTNSIAQKFMLLGFSWSEIQASELEEAVGQPQSVLFVGERSRKDTKSEPPVWMNAFRNKGLVKRVWIDSNSRVDCNSVRAQLCGVLGPVVGCFLGKCEATEQLQVQAIAKAQGFIWVDCSTLTLQRLKKLLFRAPAGRERFFLYGYPQTPTQAAEFLNFVDPPQFVLHNSASSLPVAQELLSVFDSHPNIMQLDLASAQTLNGSSKLRSIFFRKQVVTVAGSVNTLHLPHLREVVCPLGYDVLDLRHDALVHQTDDAFAGIRQVERRVQAVQAPRCLVVGTPQTPSFYHALEARIGCALHKLLILQHIQVRVRAPNATDDGDSDDYSDDDESHVHVAGNDSEGDDTAVSTRSGIKWRKVMQALSPELSQLLQTFAASSTSSISIDVLGFLENAPVGSSRVVQDVAARLRPRLFGVVGHPFSFYQSATRCFCRRHLVGFVDLTNIGSSLGALQVLETLVATTPHAVYCLDGFPRSSLPDAAVSSTTALPPRYVAQQLWELDRRLGSFNTLVHFTTSLEMLEERTPEQVTRRMLDVAQDDLELASADLVRWFATGKNHHRRLCEVMCDRTLEDVQEELNRVLQRALWPRRPATKQRGG